MKTRLSSLLLASTLLLLAGCGGGKPAGETAAPKAETPAAPTTTEGAKDATATTAFPGMEADLAKVLQEQSSFYVFKTPADLPATLTWENSDALPEFADPNAKKGGTFNYFMQDFPRTLRVIGPDATGGMRQYLWDYTGLYLAHEHPNQPGKLYAGIADSWAIDTESKTVYFKISPQATWSDGKPITTDDYIFSLYLYRSAYIREPWYNDFHTKTWEKVTVFDKHTIAFTLKERRPDLPIRAAQGLFIFPKHAMADFGPDFIEKYQWRILPTTGAYTLEEKNIDKGQSVTLTRNKEWWAKDRRFFRGRFNPDRYRMSVIRDADKAFESFLRGDLDFFLGMTTQPKYWYDLLPDTHPDVAGGYIHKHKFFNQIPRPDWGLWINRAKPGLDNNDVRVGLNYAANFAAVAKQYFRGDAVQMNTRSDGYSWRMHPTLTARTYDVEKARAAFAKAGYTKQGPDGILSKEDGTRLSFTISTYAPTVRDVMAILKADAAKAGLELNLEVLDQSTGWKKVQEKNHEIALIALSRSVELYPRYWEMYHGSNANRPQTNNMTNTNIPELDKLIEAYDRTQTLDETKKLAEQIEQIIYDDAAWVPGWAFPFYRIASWRWVRWPAGFNGMTSRHAEELFVHWIDSDLEKETKAARKNGTTFPAEVKVYDQFK